MADIEITFDLDGTSTMKVNGAKGKSCKDITASFEKALGTVIEDKKNPEYFQEETNKSTIRRG